MPVSWVIGHVSASIAPANHNTRSANSALAREMKPTYSNFCPRPVRPRFFLSCEKLVRLLSIWKTSPLCCAPRPCGICIVARWLFFGAEVGSIATTRYGQRPCGAQALGSSERAASLSGGEWPADALQRLALRRDAEARRD